MLSKRESTPYIQKYCISDGQKQKTNHYSELRSVWRNLYVYQISTTAIHSDGLLIHILVETMELPYFKPLLRQYCSQILTYHSNWARSALTCLSGWSDPKNREKLSPASTQKYPLLNLFNSLWSGICNSIFLLPCNCNNNSFILQEIISNIFLIILIILI